MKTLLHDMDVRREGREEGREETSRSVAERMLAQGEPSDKILLYTGISREDLDKLVEKNQ